MKPELLMPAGNLEKLEYAIKYGADAVYLGVVDFSLRSMRKGELITFDNLKQAIDLAHSLGAKAYLTLNIFAFNNDIENLEKSMPVIKETNPDAIILSDLGVFKIVKKYMPDVPIHVSTQTNTLNYEAVKFWQDLGAKRVILARELPISDVAQIRKKVPDIELEVFVHGSQCMSFSGRCLLSDYMTDNERKANQGNCSQPCRWEYALVERTRPDQQFEIHQTERGAHILSPKDLCLVEHLQKLIDAGVNSFKVEGRTKSLYYVSAVAKAYRNAIDEVVKNPQADLSKYFEELKKVGNRGYTQGFYLGKHDENCYNYETSKGLAGADFLCEFWEKAQDGFYKVKIKNKILLNDKVEIITPDEQFLSKVVEIKDKDGVKVNIANTNDELFLKFSKEPKDYKYALARTIDVLYINKKVKQ
ncbi:MAG TPA: U32 family peptidase [Candidatus Gastranaerophilaceae bacterium]|nr:U32 family peptidase [Candidatus Gastranaerophilaceae bacterium]HPT41184.1 U32 family peptidase [Candidatus Gastranaerophilaceae bacterium]